MSCRCCHAKPYQPLCPYSAGPISVDVSYSASPSYSPRQLLEIPTLALQAQDIRVLVSDLGKHLEKYFIKIKHTSFHTSFLNFSN